VKITSVNLKSSHKKLQVIFGSPKMQQDEPSENVGTGILP
jgi:hypothetical protein